MLTGYTLPTIGGKHKRYKVATSSSAINRLLAAAVVNKNFCDLLLTDPARALAQGFQGENFHLDDRERLLVLNIQAENLKDFALQVISFPENKLQDQREAWIPVKQNTLVLEPG